MADPKEPQDPKDPNQDTATKDTATKDPDPQDTKDTQNPAPKKDPVPYDEFAKARSERKEALDKLRVLEDEKKKAEESKLAEEGKYKELSETKDRELAETKSKYETSLKKVRFAELALKEGVVNVDDAFRLSSLEAVTIADDGSIVGMEDVVTKIKEEKPYLFGEQNQSLGGGSNPPKDGDTMGGKRVYKQSQIEDPEFYAKNKADIIKAYGEGRVENG